MTWSAATPPVYVLRATSKTPSLDSVQVSTTEQRNTRNSMYVCVYIYIHVCVHVCMYVSCMYLCNYLLVCSYPSVYVFI